jgi:hypothetical protein
MTDTAPSTTTDRPTQRAATTTEQTHVPPDEEPYVCAHCDEPFAREQYLALHRGLEHYGQLSEDERVAFDEAYDDENAELYRFRIVALGGLVALYFLFLFAYALIAV